MVNTSKTNIKFSKMKSVQLRERLRINNENHRFNWLKKYMVLTIYSNVIYFLCTSDYQNLHQKTKVSKKLWTLKAELPSSIWQFDCMNKEMVGLFHNQITTNSSHNQPSILTPLCTWPIPACLQNLSPI